MEDDERVVVQKVSVGEVAQVRDQLRQLVRIGIFMLVIVTATNLYGFWEQHKQESCGHRIVRVLNERSRYATDLDDITTQKFLLDKMLTNRQLDLVEYNKKIDALVRERDVIVKERNSHKFPALKDCE